ncbi:S-adenosyl-L-methionine-dependent methyltransferase [Apiospora phragmitis]|uniref:S-adenosyl-L-methionine-dependent methyltransferase n=1 Tax=Apiospora phragmitis TaxID=2905665 RepID=A0ABR1UGQ9_9PEZI
MRDTLTLIRAAFNAVSTTDDFAHCLAGWLEEAGFETVQREDFDVDIGPRCKDPIIGQRGIDAMVQSREALLGAAKRINARVDASVTDRLLERLEKELMQGGAT